MPQLEFESEGADWEGRTGADAFPITKPLCQQFYDYVLDNDAILEAFHTLLGQLYHQAKEQDPASLAALPSLSAISDVLQDEPPTIRFAHQSPPAPRLESEIIVPEPIHVDLERYDGLFSSSIDTAQGLFIVLAREFCAHLAKSFSLVVKVEDFLASPEADQIEEAIFSGVFFVVWLIEKPQLSTTFYMEIRKEGVFYDSNSSWASEVFRAIKWNHPIRRLPVYTKLNAAGDVLLGYERVSLYHAVSSSSPIKVDFTDWVHTGGCVIRR